MTREHQDLGEGEDSSQLERPTAFALFSCTVHASPPLCCSPGPLPARELRLALLSEGLGCLAGVCGRHGGALEAERERED